MIGDRYVEVWVLSRPLFFFGAAPINSQPVGVGSAPPANLSAAGTKPGSSLHF